MIRWRRWLWGDAGGAVTRDAGGVSIIGEDLGEAITIAPEPRVPPVVKPRASPTTKPKFAPRVQTRK
jgi:hypothetical protein